jgi:hypothetical protein
MWVWWIPIGLFMFFIASLVVGTIRSCILARRNESKYGQTVEEQPKLTATSQSSEEPAPRATEDPSYYAPRPNGWSH